MPRKEKHNLLRSAQNHDILNREKRKVDWYDFIDEFGYHDQSHLIKDFHHYLGTTPPEF